jgi:phospholipid/cholesterol/gamma-HCH transport system substrate-binding protein
MQHARTWKDLKTGIVATSVVLAAAVVILIFGRVGALHGKKFTLYVTTDGARGVIRGTDVWLDGQKVGLVKAIDFRPPSVSPTERLVLRLSVLDDARPHIRLNTRTTVRSGGSILGDQVVSLSSGTSAARQVVDGDTIRAGAELDLEGMTSDAAIAAAEFPGILENVKLLNTQLQTAQGTLAAFGMEGGTARLRHIGDRTARLFAMVGDSTGSVGRAMRGLMNEPKPVTGRVGHAMAQVDSIRALLSSGQHSLGRFRRDSTLALELGRLRSELASVTDLASNPSGTLGRFRTDSAISISVRHDIAEVDSLIADMKKRPLRYIAP